jgi:hypothetical protein
VVQERGKGDKDTHFFSGRSVSKRSQDDSRERQVSTMRVGKKSVHFVSKTTQYDLCKDDGSYDNTTWAEK